MPAPTMLLRDLAAALPVPGESSDRAGQPLGEIVVRGIAYDSRRVRPGDLFVALPGLHVDGRRFIAQAVERGAVAAVCQAPRQQDDGDVFAVPCLVVPDARAAMADLAAALYGHPARHLHMVGVTGTDGKTTTSTLVHAMLQGTGRPAGLIGTVAFRIGDRVVENVLHQTTPEAPDVQGLLAAMVDERLESAVVEVSSHALSLDRVRGCRFDTAVLTNITSDHLDFHGTRADYLAAKARLFEGLGDGPAPARARTPVAILNRDDASYDPIAARTATTARVLSYGRHPEAQVRAARAEVTAAGIRLRVETPAGEVTLHSPLTGEFNVSNLLAALAVAVAREVPLPAAAEALGALAGVPGRMQRVDRGQSFTVMIDFAHTTDALAKALDTMRAVTPPPGRLIAVFGSAGERDSTKRAPMGRAAAERCALVILTDDDPRSEDGAAILDDIAAGARAAGARDGESLLLCRDRRAAIGLAMRAARPGDTVLLAGKGHERSITIGTVAYPWDEEAAAVGALAGLTSDASPRTP